MKIKGALISEMSGSLGGITASHNRGGYYLRQRVIPVNPGSPQQVEMRSFMSDLTSAWLDTLTQAQRDGWDNYALQVPISDALGEPRNIGGIAQYIRSNSPRLQAGLTTVDDAPSIFNLGTYTAPTIDSITAPAGADIAFTAGDAWVDEDGAAMTILASRGVNPTVNYFKGPYRFAGIIAGDATTPPTSPATIVLPFPVVAGQKVFFQFRVTRADGRITSPFRLGGIAA